MAEWISVKDRLPEDVYGTERKVMPVIVCTSSGKVSECSRCKDQRPVRDENGATNYVYFDHFYWNKYKRVTHWMPLPEPPKEDNANG